jgi:putative ABC transport system substrate-binding protein
VGKQLELLKEAVPKVSRVGVFVNPTNPVSALWKETQAAAQALAVRLQPVEANGPNDLESAFAVMLRDRASAVLILPLPLTYAHARRIAELAANGQLPTVYPFKEGAEVGGLMSYGARASDMFRRAAAYVDKILRGSKPADLPVEQPTKFELVINLKTAKALGLTIPPSLLLRADQVIE